MNILRSFYVPFKFLKVQLVEVLTLAVVSRTASLQVTVPVILENPPIFHYCLQGFGGTTLGVGTCQNGNTY